MNFYVSSLAFLGKSIQEVDQLAFTNGLKIEFSSTFVPQKSLIKDYYSLKVERLPHNYFPPPIDPFVLNLASRNEVNRKRSIRHCISGLQLAKNSGGKYFSAHAGFCIEPRPEELGTKIIQGEIEDRELNWNLFVQSCNIIEKRACEMNMVFLIENNVLAPFNVRRDKRVPFLCVDPNEIKKLFETINSNNFGFLLDTAHLKVSANTLSFDLNEALDLISPYIFYIHHSDNNGLEDTNNPIYDDYWFLPKMFKFQEVIHVLEVRDQNIENIKRQQELLESKI